MIGKYKLDEKNKQQFPEETSVFSSFGDDLS